MKIVNVKRVRNSPNRPGSGGPITRQLRIYFHPTGSAADGTITERRREYRRLLDEVYAIARVSMTIDELQAGRRAAWSAKAGCSCGCSPGFVVKNHMCSYVLWVDVIGDEDLLANERLGAAIERQVGGAS